MAALLLICLFVVNPHDRAMLDAVRGPKKDPMLDRIAGEIGHWGDFALFNLGGAALIWSYGFLIRSRWFQRLAMATLVAAILAGVTCNAFRFTAGRARPKAEMVDQFYGLPGSLNGWNFHGFPSGHSSTAFGSGMPVVTAGGIWGLPVLAFSTSVGWARMYKNQHYPTDVIVGGFLGVLYGLAASWRLRKIRLRLNHRKRRKKREARRLELAAT